MTKILLETDIFNYKTPEFFINMKDIPDKKSSERKDFVLEEKKKCREGINVNGVHIPGSLYFHLNYYHLQGDDLITGKKSVFLPRLRDNEWIFFNDYEEAYRNRLSYTFFGLRQAGKDLLNSSILYIKDGEITIGDCRVGQEIFDDSGKLTKITGVYPQGKRPVYRISLLDGRKIYCGLDHNWRVFDRRSSKYFVKTTKELLINYKHQRTDWVGVRKNTYEFRYGIQNSKCVEYEKKEQLISPYLLGLWGGDGSNYYSKITTKDKEIADYLYSEASKMGLQITKDGELTYMITAKDEGNKHSKKNIFHKFLQDKGLYKNKHIPFEYLYGSEEQRLELLKGLMDSDGTCDKNGNISFSSSIPTLTKDFIKLCNSLGITTTSKIKPASYKKNGALIKCKDSTHISLHTDKIVFKLKRKIDNCISKKKFLNFTSIVGIEYVFDDYTTCITVDNKSHLFLTDNYTVTHNSEMEASLCLRELSLYKETEAIALFSRSPDKDTFVKKMFTAINHGESFMIVPNIDKDWSKEEIRFGLTKVDNTVDLRARLYIYNTQEGKKIQAGSGKALKHGSNVYTESGINTIENCKVGDKIYGRDGKLTTIVGVHPQGIVDLFKISLTDGRSVECSGDHLWTLNRTDKIKNKVETIDTYTLFTKYKRVYFDSNLNKDIHVNRYTLPRVEPIEYPSKKVSVDPYYLGLWLGDGTTKSPSHITTKDNEIVEYLKCYADILGGRLTNKCELTYKISNNIDFKHTPLIKLFDEYDLKNNKHIPKEYLFNTKEVRLELLRGLMDSDGYVNKNGIISISLSNEKLIKDVTQLIRSLGLSCTLSTKKTSYFNKKHDKKIVCKDSYILYLGHSDIPLFKLKRKLERQNFKKRNSIGIASVEKIEPGLATCISVDNSESLFLTNDFIPTHNSPSFMLMDEIAISPFRGVYDVLEPALLSDSGSLRCSPIFTFTGGEVEKAKDAESFVKFPTEKQFKTTLDDGNVVGGRFLSGLYRKDCKEETVFSKYIGKKTNTWLDNYPIYVSDKNKAKQKIEDEKVEASKSPDNRTLLLKRIFFPLTLEDVFLTESNNKFPREAIEQHQTWLKEHYEPINVEFYRDLQGKVMWKHSDLKPISKFPIKPDDDKLAPFCIYEHPVPNAPNFTYCIGIDPINNDDSNDKVVSLFSISVYKRMISPLDYFKNQVVASYAGRPKELSDAHELALMVAEYYNAIEGVLPEASENSIFQYFFLKKKGHYLANSFDLVTEINKKTSFRGKKGYPATTPNQRHGMNLLVESANTEHILVDEEGEESMRLGVGYEYDYMLLEEYKNYKGKTGGKGVHDGNYDRIISRYCAEVLAKYYDVKYPIAQYITLKEPEVRYNRKKNINVFGTSISLIPKYQSPLTENNQKSTQRVPGWLKGK